MIDPAAGPPGPPGPPAGLGPALQLFAVTGIGEVRAGDDLADLILEALAGSGEQLLAGDVLVISSKIVSKAEGRVVAADTRDEQIIAQTVRPVAARRTPRGVARIVQAAAGPVMAAAGVDASNVAPGTVLLLPADPDASARALRAQFQARTGLALGVVVSDTAGRAWRAGQVDFALGAAGVQAGDDLRGAVDGFGQPLEVTVRALVDELAAATDLVKGKLGGLPVAVVRGFAAALTEDDGPGAASLLRPGAEDWFRFGHVEAVRAGLGVADGEVEYPSVLPESIATRLDRALDLAQHGSPFRTATLDPGSPFSSRMILRLAEEDSDAVLLQVFTGTASTTDAGEVGPDHWLCLGSLAERVHVAAWSEDLAVEVTVTPGPPPGLRVSATDRR